VARGLIIPMIIQTTQLAPSQPNGTDDVPHVSRLDPTGANQSDAEHPPTDLVVVYDRAGWGAWHRLRSEVLRLAALRPDGRLIESVGSYPSPWRPDGALAVAGQPAAVAAG
jgi:hypothetical protein